jgi:hypothetical protein
LFDDPLFVAKYKESWIDKYNEFVAMANFIETQGAIIRPAVLEDSKRWFIPGGYREEYDTDHARQVETMINWWNDRVSYLNTQIDKIESVPKSKNFGAVTIVEGYSDIPPQTFTLVAYGKLDNVTVKFKEGASSVYEIAGSYLNAEATGGGSYMAAVSVQVKNGLPLGIYNDELIFSGKNRGADFTVSVPLSFAYTKLIQKELKLGDVKDKVFGDENFFLTATGGSGKGEIIFALISGNAVVDELTGEVEITGAGDIVVVAIKAEDEDYQEATSPELTIPVAKAEPEYTVPTGLTAIIGKLLSSVTMPENWEWEDDTLLIDKLGEQTFLAKYIPEDSVNYFVVNNIEVTVTVDEDTGIFEVSKPNPLRVWISNGLLHATGITPGETLSIYTITGTLVYRCIATSDEMDIPLRMQGVYFIRAGNWTVKIVNYELN